MPPGVSVISLTSCFEKSAPYDITSGRVHLDVRCLFVFLNVNVQEVDLSGV